MDITVLIIIVVALIKNLILYFLGRILTRPDQLRHFLGLNDNSLNNDDYEKTSSWVKKIGKLIMLYAIINFMITATTTLDILN